MRFVSTCSMVSDNSPVFSIVMPTYNRAHLLPFAIESVLRQSFGDFEIVISDGASTDNTEEVVAGFKDERIRYFNTGEKVPVGDNYQNGLDRAAGEYITFLSDDDAYTPYLLERAKQIIDEKNAEIVGYQYCRYYHDDLYDFERRVPKNSLLVERFDGSVTKFTAKESIEQIYALHGLSGTKINADFICPYLSNAVYHKSIFSRLRTVTPKLFHTVPPDIYLAVAVFFAAEDYYCLDEPLLVWSNWKGNATVSAQRGQNSVREHYEKLLDGRELNFMPLKFAQAFNCGANTILQAESDFGRDDVEMDWATYFFRTYENFIYLKSVGINVDRETKEFWAVLETQPPEVAEKVKAEISKAPFAAKQFLNSNLPGVAALIRKVLRVGKESEFRLIKGGEVGFSNVLEAAQHVK